VHQEPVYCGSNPKSWHTARILFQWVSRSALVHLLCVASGFAGRRNVTLQPSSRIAFMPYRLFATNLAPRSVSDDFHALKASVDMVLSLKLCVFKVISPAPPLLFAMLIYLRP